jgi:hypothetical protein
MFEAGCIAYTLYRLVKGLVWSYNMFMADRSGNSGRFKHWSVE